MIGNRQYVDRKQGEMGRRYAAKVVGIGLDPDSNPRYAVKPVYELRSLDHTVAQAMRSDFERKKHQ